MTSNINADLLVQRYIGDKIFMKILSAFSRKTSQIVEKCPIARCVEESVKKFPDPDSEADDFQNLISSSFSTVTSLVKLCRSEQCTW